jgi:hypothetical protein
MRAFIRTLRLNSFFEFPIEREILFQDSPRINESFLFNTLDMIPFNTSTIIKITVTDGVKILETKNSNYEFKKIK